MKLENIIEIAIVTIAFVFGYGVLNNKVEALEAKAVAEREMIFEINKNITSIKEDVSYIKGKIERK